MKRIIFIAPFACLAACGPGSDTADNDQQVRSAFDGVWRWTSAGKPMYDLTIAGGHLQKVSPASHSARSLPYERCYCAIDDVDGLQAIQLISDVDERGHRLRWVFSFVEEREFKRRSADRVNDGVFFEEVITPEELPSPRTLVQRGSLRRLTF